MKHIRLILISFLLGFSFCNKENVEPIEEDNYTEGEQFQLEVNFDNSKGEIAIEPNMDSYPEGTKVKLIAKPNEGQIFKNWKLNSELYVQKEITFTVEQNYTIDAEFIEAGTGSYSIDLNYDKNQGNVTISPILESYTEGTTVTISAISSEGYSFSHWSGINSTASTFTFDITQNLSIEAFFSETDENKDSKPVLELEIICENDVWQIKGEFYDDSKTFSEGISDATIKVNNQILIADNFFIGEYSGTLDGLTPGQNVTVILSHSTIGEQTYELVVPNDFTETPSLKGSNNNGNLVFNWESINCDEYMLYKLVENNYGTQAKINVSGGVPFINNTYSTTINNLLTSNLYMSPTASYFTFWVCPANRLRNLNKLESESYILIIGKKSNGITNKPV